MRNPVARTNRPVSTHSGSDSRAAVRISVSPSPTHTASPHRTGGRSGRWSERDGRVMAKRRRGRHWVETAALLPALIYSITLSPQPEHGNQYPHRLHPNRPFCCGERGAGRTGQDTAAAGRRPAAGRDRDGGKRGGQRGSGRTMSASCGRDAGTGCARCRVCAGGTGRTVTGDSAPGLNEQDQDRLLADRSRLICRTGCETGAVAGPQTTCIRSLR